MRNVKLTSDGNYVFLLTPNIEDWFDSGGAYRETLLNGEPCLYLVNALTEEEMLNASRDS